MKNPSTPFFRMRVSIALLAVAQSTHGIHGDHQWPTTSLAGCLAVGALGRNAESRREDLQQSTYKNS
jgi:hypothetical protein